MSVFRRIPTAALAGLCLLIAHTAAAQVIERPNRQTVILKPKVTKEPRAADNTLGMALLGAFVNSDGTLARGSGVTNSSRFAPGGYQVFFDRDISNCTYSAVGVSFAIVRIVTISANQLQFNTNNPTTGTLTDTSFSATIYCAK
jgi:hypothetical protein